MFTYCNIEYIQLLIVRLINSETFYIGNISDVFIKLLFLYNTI